jgi:hypothetical protein
MVLLEPDSDLPGVPGALRLVNDKQKNFAAASNVHFRLTAVGDSVVPEDLGVVYAWERMAKSEDDDDEGGLRRTSAASSSRMRQDILAAATTADAEGRMPITQTDLVAPVKGNRKTKLDVLAAIVREDDSPLIMHQQGKKHLYGLRKPT